MFNRILVPLDGSSRAERAIPVAARIARAASGSVILLRVEAVPVEYGLYMSPSPNYIEEVLDAEHARATSYLEDVAKSKSLADIKVETSALFGTPAHSILSAIQSFNADLVVMCSHGNTGFKRWVLGSVAHKLARYSPVPVFVLRDGGPVPTDKHPDDHPTRALVPLDGSSLAKTALLPAAYLVAALSASGPGSLHLTRVVKPLTSGYEKGKPEFIVNLREQALYKAKKYLSSIVDHLHTDPIVNLKLVVTWSVAIDDDAADALIRVAENGEDTEGVGVFGGCDMIVMATHGRGGLERWAMGSVTERVLAGTRLPMLIVRPQEAESRQELNGEEFAETGMGAIHMGSALF